MTQVRFAVSPMSLFLQPKIKKFILDNIKAVESSKNLKPEDGSEAIANTIEYGVNLALSSPIMQAAFAVGIAPPGSPTAGGPIGSLIYNVLSQSIQE